ncbi:MAG TPA: hypothetical protein VNL73_11325 [Verrucomicrobiae bacterium]|nr:hypothetical protein [Verrucomicrobiae bacterium]
MKRFLLWANIAALLVFAVFNFFLLRQNRALHNQVENMRTQLKHSADSDLYRLASGYSPFCQLSVKKKGEEVRKPDLTLLVFLTQQDCGGCLQEAELWEKLYKTYSSRGFLAVALVRQEDSVWADQVARDFALSFPVVPLDSSIVQFLGWPPTTPFKMVVDSLQRLIYLSGPNSEPEGQKNFAEVAEKLCRAYLTN